MDNATSVSPDTEQKPSEDEVAQILGLPGPKPAYDSNVNLKVYETEVELVRLVARARGYFTDRSTPNVAQALRDKWDELVAEGRSLFEEAQRQLQNTGT